MKLRIATWLPAAALAAALVGPAQADSFRCGSRVIGDGMTTAEVRRYCGEPADISVSSVQRRPMFWRGGRPYYYGNDFIDVPVEFWLYNFGPSRLMRKIRFEGGQIKDIETLGYGYNDY